MTRSRIAVVPAVLLAALAVTSCSSGSDDKPAKEANGQPISKQFSQGEITQAIPDRGEAPAGYDPGSLGKDRPGTADDCTHTEGGSPKGWARAGDTNFFYNGSSRSRMMDLAVCQFDSPENAKTAYTAWVKREGLTPVQAKQTSVGEESSFLVSKTGSVYAYARSGTVNIEVKVADAGEDATAAHDMAATVLKRLQQIQAGKRPTATAAEIAAAAQKK
ncbi:hypothetical protein ACIQU4_27675 [Streptomyces sp. NPDC090741]|uniref:hypothetical protein n=1 Tax=Streptomyces sp. NPDC090741 TaxID=3365967 RepID=UPI00380B3433